MPVMHDAAVPTNIPNNATIVAGYVNGSIYTWPESEFLRFEELGCRVVGIDVIGDSPRGKRVVWLDVESGDATPDVVPGWVVAGGRGVYCSRDTLPAIESAMTGVRIPWMLWLAWPGWNGEVLPPNCVAVQHIYDGNYDVSTVLDMRWVPPPKVGGGVVMSSPTVDQIDARLTTGAQSEPRRLAQGADVEVVNAKVDRLLAAVQKLQSTLDSATLTGALKVTGTINLAK